VKKAMIPKFDVERLWLAVLLQTYKDIVSLDAGKPESNDSVQRKAIAWVTSNRTDTSSFVGVCSTLGLDLGHVRFRVLQTSRNISKMRRRLKTLLSLSFPAHVAKAGERVRLYG